MIDINFTKGICNCGGKLFPTRDIKPGEDDDYSQEVQCNYCGRRGRVWYRDPEGLEFIQNDLW